MRLHRIGVGASIATASQGGKFSDQSFDAREDGRPFGQPPQVVQWMLFIDGVKIAMTPHWGPLSGRSGLRATPRVPIVGAGRHLAASALRGRIARGAQKRRDSYGNEQDLFHCISPSWLGFRPNIDTAKHQFSMSTDLGITVLASGNVHNYNLVLILQSRDRSIARTDRSGLARLRCRQGALSLQSSAKNSQAIDWSG